MVWVKKRGVITIYTKNTKNPGEPGFGKEVGAPRRGSDDTQNVRQLISD